MNPIDLLANTWIWYALFGVVAALFFLRGRGRSLMSFAERSSGSPGSGASAHTHNGHDLVARSEDGEPTPPGDAQPSRTADHAMHGGRRRHGCC